MSKRKFAKWYCHGCEKHHSVDRYIEGTTGAAEYWCAHAMRKALKEGRNYRPPDHQYEAHR